jgi:D-3-phosphoglycerate dehydrogenase
MPTVLISDPVHPVASTLLAEAGLDVRTALKKSNEELAELASDVEAWIVRSGTQITAGLMAAAPRLRVVGRAGVGVDNVDVEAATLRGVLVINAPEGNTISTAEHTVAMLLALARHVPQASASLREGRWDRKSWMGAELYGKTLGIVGAGKIGRAVAERMRAFGMTVLGFDPLVTPEAAERSGLALVPFEELVERSDFITVHTPLNDATRGLFDRRTIARCKPGVRLVNCARGGIIDEADLLEALESGHVAGAALDVYSAEPPPESLGVLLRHRNVIATPHIAASTEEAQEKVARQVTEEVILALRDEPVQNAVNGIAVRMAGQREVKPYLDLADRLARIARQLHGGRTERVVVRCHGDVPRRFGEVLVVSALRGMLSGTVTAPVNLVNAVALADETGLKSDLETWHDPGSYTNLVEVVVEGEGRSLAVAGTIFGAEDPRVVRIDGFSVEVRPEGQLLFYRNVDRPGMLARVGALLAEGGVNIAGLALGRQVRGQTALTAISVDDAIPDSVLERIRGLEGVEEVRQVDV